MSTSNRRAVYVGLFVVIASAIFAGAILAVGSLQNAFTPKIVVSAVFDEVGGLQEGDSIWSAGVRVGVVDSLTFVKAAKVEVGLAINESVAPFIPADAQATIGSDGLIGSPIVILAGGTADGPTVQDGDVLEIGDAVSTSDILATLQVNNENLVSITSDIKELTAGLNAGEGTLGRLLKEDDVYTQVQGALTDVQAASASAKKLTASLARFSAELEQPGQLPYELVNDDEILPSVREAIAKLEGTAARASELVDSLGTKLDEPGTPVGTLLSDTEAGGDLAATLANLEETTVLLNEDLIAIRSNFLFRPYFRKQERLEKKEAKAKAREEAKAR